MSPYIIDLTALRVELHLRSTRPRTLANSVGLVDLVRRELLIENRVMPEVQLHQPAWQAQLVKLVLRDQAVERLTTEEHERVHAAVAGDGLGEVEVDVLVLLVSGEDTHWLLEDHRAVGAERDEVHHGAKERQARVGQRQAEVALCVVDADASKFVFYFKCDCE